MIFLSMNAGAVKYNNLHSNEVFFSDTSVYGKNYDVKGTIIDGSVGAKQSYGSITNFNKDTIIFTFDYDIESANLFGKTSQSVGATSDLSSMVTIDKDKRRVYLKSTLKTTIKDIYLMLWVNGDFGTSYNLVQNLENCTSNISGDKIDEGTDKEIVLTCNDGFIFDGVPTITIGGNTLDFNLNNDLTVASIIVDIIDDIVISAAAKANIRVFITGTITNAACNYVNGEFLNPNKDIIISANSGYTFKSQYSYKDGSFTKFFSNEKTYLITSTKTRTRSLYLDDNYNATKEIEQVGTFVNLYKTNQTELTDLSKVRFSESNGQRVDYGNYINSLYILPFDIPRDILGDTSTILLGNLDSNVESTLIATYMYELEGGTIEVPLKYNNIYDFVNTECVLHLPFLDKVFLNSEYVIGQKLTIAFTIELYSGSLTANIISSFNNEIVASIQGLIGMNIPFIQKSNGGVINGISNVYKNKNKRCFIEVIRNIPYTKNNNVFGGSVVEYGKIGDYEGYLECDSLVLNTKATNQEQEEIKNIIRNGVFI